MEKINSNDRGKIRRAMSRIFFLFFALVFVYYVPLFPYMPDCTDKTAPSHLWSIFLSNKYQKEFVDGLRIYNVEYISIGSVVFLSLRDWFDTDDWVVNASNKSVLNLVDSDWGANEAELPEYVKKIVAESRTRHRGDIEETCELVRAVAVEGW